MRGFINNEQFKDSIDLILTDVEMPRMSGRELVNRLIPLHPEMKVIFMSGYTDDSNIRNAVLHETAQFIQKPFSPVSLLQKVRETLESN